MKRIKAKAPSTSVVYDPVAGACWFPMLVKSLVPTVKTICSDISPPAVDTARRNFAENKLDGRFLLGDLFEPLRKLIKDEGEEDLKPQYVYFLPPQERAPDIQGEHRVKGGGG